MSYALPLPSFPYRPGRLFVAPLPENSDTQQQSLQACHHDQIILSRSLGMKEGLARTS